MADKVVGVKLKLDTGDANASAKGFNDTLGDVQDNLKDTEAQAKQTGETVKTTGGSFSKLKDQLTAIPGPVGQASQAVTGLGTAFKALLANPIVLLISAIVGALALLYKAFASTNDGADKLEQIFKGVGAVIDVLRDRFLKLASAISSFFKGDFAEAFQIAREAYTGIGDEITAEFQKAADATALLQEVEDAVRELGVSRAKLNRDLAEARELISDENASYAEKKKAIEAVRIAEGQQTEQEIANAKKKLEAIRQLNALSDTSDEDLQKEADAQAELFRLEEQSAKNIRTLNKQEAAIARQEQAKRREAAAAAAAKEKEEREKLVAFNTQLAKLQQDNVLATITDQYERELKALEFKIAGEKAANEQAVKDRRLTREQADKLSIELDIQAQNQRDAIARKRQEEVKKKEEDFQKELAEIEKNIRLKGIVDTRELERVQLEIGYEEKLQDAAKRYADDAEKLNQIRQAIDEQYRIENAEMERKFAEEDAKKKFEAEQKALEAQQADPQATFEARQAAIDAEIELFKSALDQKLITEQQYNEQVKGLTQARIDLANAERDQKIATFGEIGNAFNTLSGLVGKQTAAGKAFAVASATIAAIQSAINSFNSLSVIPIVGPALGAVAAAGAIAAGIANVKKIVSVQIPGQSAGGGSVPVPTAPQAPIAPTQTSTRLDAATVEQLGQKSSTRAYVVNGDIKDNQDRDARLERAARLGG